MIGKSEFSTDEIAEALGCCRNNTSRKIQQFQDGVEFLTRAYFNKNNPRRLRADNVAAQMLALMETGGRLAAFDQQRCRRFVQQIISGRMITQGRDRRA